MNVASQVLINYPAVFQAIEFARIFVAFSVIWFESVQDIFIALNVVE